MPKMTIKVYRVQSPLRYVLGLPKPKAQLFPFDVLDSSVIREILHDELMKIKRIELIDGAHEVACDGWLAKFRAVRAIKRVISEYAIGGKTAEEGE